MAKVELSEETKAGVEESGTAVDLLIAVVAPADAALLRSGAAEATLAMSKVIAAGSPISALRTVVAYPGGGGLETPAESTASATAEGGTLRFVPYTQATGGTSVIPWLPAASAYQPIFAMARELGASVCAVIGFDLAALQAHSLSAMLAPVFEKECDLAMPLYALGKFDGLLNSSILAPLTRALYGRRVRFPLAPDFCLSAGAIPSMETSAQRSAALGQTLFWPATEAALRDNRIGQVHVDTRHATAADGVDLSTVLAQTVGPLFADLTVNASLWQRTRGSQPVPTFGAPGIAPLDSTPAATQSMVDTFQLGYRNLQEVWSLVLPPVTLLDLKKLTRSNHESFHFPDELWVRIIYDFALAHRLRTLSRTHLFGALTPLYLGWVASYALEVGNASAAEAEQRLEKLARAYEDGKPYLLSRWRWPDRFNP